MRKTFLAACILAGLMVGAAGGETIGWRSDGTGMYPQTKVGLKWDTKEGIAWSVPLKKWSNATAVVVGERIIVGEEPDVVVCVSRSDGKELWRQVAGYKEAGAAAPENDPRTHKTNGYTSPTPATDGKFVVSLNGLGIAACFDMEGKRQWIKYLVAPSHNWGTSSSVVIAGDRAIVHIRDTVYALDLASGKDVWQAKSASRWGSSVVTKCGETQVLFTPSGDFIDVESGKILAGKVADLNYNSPLVQGGVVYFMCGEHGCNSVKLPEKMTAEWKPEVLWTAAVGKKDRTYSSPVVVEGLVYVLTRGGRLSAFDAAKGERVWEQDMKFEGTAYPSLLVAGELLLVSSDTGSTAVVKPGREFKEVRRNVLEPFRSTPVIVGDLMYVRTGNGLVCVKGVGE